MTKFRKLIKHISNLRDALRVLEIMDECGAKIEQVEGCDKYWRVKIPWYLTERDANDLETIVLHKQHYKKTSKLFYKLFNSNRRYGYRDFYWSEEYYNQGEDLD